MKYSGVGGQAVMEGVMMKNEDRYAVAVRKPDHTIDVKVSTFKETIKNKKLRRKRHYDLWISARARSI